jgi:YfiH family protein
MHKVYPFNLDWGADGPGFAAFPFVMDGVPVAGLSCGISSRSAGDMAYSGARHNTARKALLGALGLRATAVYGLNQIHSRRVLAVDRDHPPAGDADGMVSADRDIVLSATVADCLPVYLLDTETGAFGLLHSGWKGTGIVREALQVMAGRWHTRPASVAAVLGPCIGSRSYKVDGDRAAAFAAEFGSIPPDGDFEPVALQGAGPAGPEWYLDLKAANIRLLAAAGVRNISVCGDCTCADSRLGSFRREGAAYTRMLALCGCLHPSPYSPP